MVEVLLVLIFLFLVALVVRGRLTTIVGNLRLAEQELAREDAIATEHAGRRARNLDRREWSQLEPPTLVKIYSGRQETVTHRLVAENERELQAMGAANEKVKTTAELLILLYRADIPAARVYVQGKIANGTSPHVATGIGAIIGYPGGPGASWMLLALAVYLWRFPERFTQQQLEQLGRRAW